jgi:ribokinase
VVVFGGAAAKNNQSTPTISLTNVQHYGILGRMTIVVFGSLNMDLVAQTMRLPMAGETVAGLNFHTEAGGKGANQAVACARLGATTRLVGRSGADDFGSMLRASMQISGVDIQYVETTSNAPTGVAIIAIDERGENTIIVVPGANGTIASPDIERLKLALADAQLLLLQLEVPLPMVEAAAKAARERGITVMIDPAPAQPLPDAIFKLADILTPNETEAAALVGFSLDTEADIELAASLLRDRGAQAVVIKLGARGAYTLDSTGGRFHDRFAVTPIDTVGAGDAFNAGLAVALAEGKPFHEAVRWGLATGAIAVTRSGAQAAMPRRAEVEEFIANRH